MKKIRIVSGIMAATILGTAAVAQDVTLTIESWRNDDLTIWQDQIIPAFEAANPGIKLLFAPTAPAQYNSALNAKLEAGTAGDLITCRPFDGSLVMYQAGHLEDLTDLAALDNFGGVAKSGWSTDDGSATYCIPMASVIHGFIYNKDAFAEVGVEAPSTVDEFYAVLDAINADGNYTPLSMGTADEWEAATMGYANVGTKYWSGEAGRAALIAGTAKLTDAEWVAGYEELARWGQYMGDGFQAQSYPDSQNVFTLGRAAIYPAGSWEISGFNANADFELGAFAPPRARFNGYWCWYNRALVRQPLGDEPLPSAFEILGTASAPIRGWRRMLHLGSRRHCHRHEPGDREPGCGENLPKLGRFLKMTPSTLLICELPLCQRVARRRFFDLIVRPRGHVTPRMFTLRDGKSRALTRMDFELGARPHPWRRRMLHLGSRRHCHRHEPGDREPGCGENLPKLGRFR